MPLYIEKNNGDVVQPSNRRTDRVNIEQSAFFESLKIEKKQRFAIYEIYNKLRHHESHVYGAYGL